MGSLNFGLLLEAVQNFHHWKGDLQVKGKFLGYWLFIFFIYFSFSALHQKNGRKNQPKSQKRGYSCKYFSKIFFFNFSKISRFYSLVDWTNNLLIINFKSLDREKVNLNFELILSKFGFEVRLLKFKHTFQKGIKFTKKGLSNIFINVSQIVLSFRDIINIPGVKEKIRYEKKYLPYYFK